MGCGVYWQQVHEIERALGTMEKFGIDPASEAYRKLYAERGKLMKQIGFKFPRVVNPLATLSGMSPGIIKLWHDIESGWMSEAREQPGAPPVYHMVQDEVAMAILKGELTPELEKELMAPDYYYGE